MKKTWSRLICMVLVLVMVLGVMPAALADEAQILNRVERTPSDAEISLIKGGSSKTVTVAAYDQNDQAITSGLAYQWYSGDAKGSITTPVTGGTASAYTFTADTVGTVWYKCAVSQTGGNTIYSNAFDVKVTDAPAYQLILSAQDTLTVGKYCTIGSTVKASGVTQSTGYKTVLSITTADKEYATLTNSKLTAYGTNSANNKSVTVTGKLYAQTDTSYANVLATDTVSITLKAASAENINVVLEKGYGTLGVGKQIYDEVLYVCGGKMSYIEFDDTTSGLTLYTSSSSKAKKVASIDEFYYKNTLLEYSIDDVYAQLDAKKTSGTATYSAFDSNDNLICTGKIVISLNELETISYSSTGKDVYFDADDFEDYFEDYYTTATFDHVTFKVDKFTYCNTTTYGYLYAILKNKTLVKKNVDYSYDDLDDIVFVPGNSTKTYTASLPFTAYNALETKSLDGTVKITVTVSSSGTTTTSSTSTTGSTFKTMKLSDQVEDEYPTAEYVKFTLPSVSSGKLYYGYKNLSDRGTELTARDPVYIDPAKTSYIDIDELYFLPAADYSGTVKIAYTAYKTTNKDEEKLGTGYLSFTVATKTASSIFTDVSTGYSWAANAVDVMQASGLVTGRGASKFAPADNMSRRDLVLILYRYAGSPSVTGIVNPFKDVKTNDYAYNAILWAYNKKIVTGTSATTFNPAGNVTRQEIAKILWAAEGSKTVTQSLSSYTDMAQIASWAQDGMKWAVYNGFVKGSGSKLNPKGTATRAEVATILYRYFLSK